MKGIELIPKELQKRMVERSNGILETDEQCDVKGHEKYYKFLMPNGELVCPKCYCNQSSTTFANEKTEAQYLSTEEGRKNYLYRYSILGNPKLLEKGFRDFINKTSEESRVKRETMDMSKAIAVNQIYNVFIHGGPGKGKSHLAMALLKNVNELTKNQKCLYVNMARLLDVIRKTFNDNYNVRDEAYYIELLSRVEVLVIDDIGAELSLYSAKKASDFSSRILYSVLDAREDKTTIFTSNLSITELSGLFDKRIISRITSNLKTISFEGIKDKRAVKEVYRNE